MTLPEALEADGHAHSRDTLIATAMMRTTGKALEWVALQQRVGEYSPRLFVGNDEYMGAPPRLDWQPCSARYERTR